jgi:hypothetical protein
MELNDVTIKNFELIGLSDGRFLARGRLTDETKPYVGDNYRHFAYMFFPEDIIYERSMGDCRPRTSSLSNAQKGVQNVET